MTTESAGATVGVQLFHFGRMNEADLTQHGLGLFLGWRAGGQYSKVDGAQDGSSSFAHGPTFTLSFPKYNAGTTKLTRWTISAFALYIEKFVFVNIGAGFAN